MCSEHTHGGVHTSRGTERFPASGGRGAAESAPNGPPDVDQLDLPPAYILAHLTDAHCHPTDTPLPRGTYDALPLGALAAMGTTVDDQSRVARLGEGRGWERGDIEPRRKRRRAGVGIEEGAQGARIITCFGYHPWFVHRYTLAHPIPTKEAHYLSLFTTPNSSPTSRARQLLTALIPYLPDPVPFDTLLAGLRADITSAQAQRQGPGQGQERGHGQEQGEGEGDGVGNLVMLGEVGLDAQARVRWPDVPEAREVYARWFPDRPVSGGSGQGVQAEAEAETGVKAEGDAEGEGAREGKQGQEGYGWGKIAPLTPFRTNMAHQRAILVRQLELAVELGVNVSLHSVACPGPTLDVLLDLRNRYGPHFTSRVNVDLHSAGGWAPAFYKEAQRQLRNLYASPSILITGRVGHADDLIKAINPDRMLLESDTHDARLTPKLVWGAVTWIARCKGWLVEGVDTEGAGAGAGTSVEEGVRLEEGDWVMHDEDEAEVFDAKGKKIEGEVWAVRTLERNFARFMHLVE